MTKWFDHISEKTTPTKMIVILMTFCTPITTIKGMKELQLVPGILTKQAFV